jgi:hypothetical protein
MHALHARLFTLFFTLHLLRLPALITSTHTQLMLTLTPNPSEFTTLLPFLMTEMT